MRGTLLDMARPKKEETETVRIARSVARKARILAAAADLSLPDYLTDRLALVVNDELRQVIGDMALPPAKPRKKPSD